MSTAVAAVQKGSPGAEVEASGSDSYPIMVEVIAPTGECLWQGDQRNLFRKYGMRRKKAVEEVRRTS